MNDTLDMLYRDGLCKDVTDDIDTLADGNDASDLKAKEKDTLSTDENVESNEIDDNTELGKRKCHEDMIKELDFRDRQFSQIRVFHDFMSEIDVDWKSDDSYVSKTKECLANIMFNGAGGGSNSTSG